MPAQVDFSNFDIRNMIRTPREENDYYLAGYRVINRMVCVYGDITFQKLFTEKWQTLLPSIAANVDLAFRRGFIEAGSAAEVKSNLADLAGAYKDLSFGELILGDGAYVAVNEKLIDIWHYLGVSLPIRPQKGLADSRDELNELLAKAGGFKYFEIFTESRTKNPDAAEAIRLAFDRSLILKPPINDWCCSGNVCVYRANSGCACYSDASGHCTGVYSNCP